MENRASQTFSRQTVWAKGDECLSPYSGDDVLYEGVIKKIHRSNIGKVTAVVQFDGYGDEDWEEVDIELLEKRTKKKDKAAENGSSQSTKKCSSGMFSPLVGDELENRLRAKYENNDFGDKAEELSRNLFQKKRKGKESKPLNETYTPDTSSQSKKKCKLDISGGQTLDKTKELRTSKRLSDISSILDPGRVRLALCETDNSQSDDGIERGTDRQKSDEIGNISVPRDRDPPKALSSKRGGDKEASRTSDDESDDNSAGFSESDLEKPKFNHSAEDAKVPFILSAEGETPVVQVPGTLNQYLRDYQREGIQFMYSHYKDNRGAILGDDMGLGKTVQVIGLIAALLGKHGNRVDVMRQKPKFIRKLSETACVRQDVPSLDPVLIIGPGCVLYNWMGELEVWGHFVFRKFHGADKMECLADVKKGKIEIVVTTYETFREHQNIMNTINWSVVFVDEVHKIKGLKAQTTKALRNIRTPRRFGLTGTALQNNLLELWSILDWAQPGCLGRQIDFEEEFVKPIGRGQRHDANKRELALARKKKEKFAKVRKGMMIRRMKDLIADQLPKKEENVVFCKLSELQTSIYRTILSHDDMYLVLGMDDPCECESGKPQGKCCKQVTSTGTKIRSLMFTFMHLLLKVSNHVALLIPSHIKSNWQAVNAKKICRAALKHHPEFLAQTKEASFKTLSNPKYCGKMKILQGLLKVFHKEHSKVLVFSYSTQVLDILEQYMMSTGYEYRRIDGTVSAKKRMVVVKEYNTDPNIFICLISTKAGGLGLNLTGANKVVIFDPNWNPSHDLQAQDRAYRIGQRRNVAVYRLVSAGTIEENMYLRQIYKQQLLNITVEDENARRYFYAVQGSRQKKGELFGIKNMFALRTGTSCLTADIIKRNERVESALAGYEITKYVPPVVRLEEEEDLEDVEISDETTSTESEHDYFAEFFNEGKKSDVNSIKREKTSTYPEVECLETESSRKTSAADISTIIVKSETDSDDGVKTSAKPRVWFKDTKEEDVDKPERKVNVRFKDDDDRVTKKSGGKVKPSESRRGKGSVKRAVRVNSGGLSDEEEVEYDQTLAGTFNDVTDVFENCGIVHIHENRKVVGGSKAEDHMTRCAISDVYELHQNSQDLAVVCEPLSESSSEEEIEQVHDAKLELQHNKVRSKVVGKTKILIGQTPKLFRMKQFEKLCQFYKSNDMLDFAEKVLTSSLGQRISMLKEYYEAKDPIYTDIITLEPTTSCTGRKSTADKKKPKRKLKTKGHQKKSATSHTSGLSFLDHDEPSASESLQRSYPDNGNDMFDIDGQSDSDEVDSKGSSMDVGNPSTPLSKRRRIRQGGSGRKKVRQSYYTPGGHVPVTPSYLDISLEEDGELDTYGNKVKHKKQSVHDSEMDSGALLSQMGKSSQIAASVNDIDSVDGMSVKNTSDHSIVVFQGRSRGDDTIIKSSDRIVKKTGRRNNTSILDDLFSDVNEQHTGRPPPIKSVIKSELNKDKPKTGNKRKKQDTFVEVDEIFSDGADTEKSTDCEHDIHFDTSTLKNDDFDCLDDPKLWKKNVKKGINTVSRSPNVRKVNIVDQLIADSDAEYNELFTSGRLKRKGNNDLGNKLKQEQPPSGNVGGSESLFS